MDLIDLFNACLYIQDNLDADLSLLFLAQTVGLSRFRFHRVFKAWRGETLHDFVTRMRMERAAFELSYPIPRSSRRSIKAIAFASGYKSLSSFSHAFSSYSQLSPREFRNRALQQKPALAKAVTASDPLAPFAISVARLPERRIAVLDAPVPKRNETRLAALARTAAAADMAGARYGIELLPNLLARARGEGNLPVRAARLGCVGVEVAHWNEAAGASGAAEAPAESGGAFASSRARRAAPRSAIRLEAGRYAIVEGRGSLAGLYRAWRRGFDAWLTATGECPKSGRLYVRLSETAEPGARDTAIALYVPLEDAAGFDSRPHPD